MRLLVRLNKRPSSDGSRFTYVLRYTDEQGKRRWETLGHSNKRKAEKQRAKKEKELRMGYVEPGSMRLRDFVKDSLARTGDQIRESTREEYESAMNDFIDTIGNTDYQACDPRTRRVLPSSLLGQG
jgi:phage terminase large subunit-like protein